MLITKYNYNYNQKDKLYEQQILQIEAEVHEFLIMTGSNHFAKFLKWRSINSKKVRSLKK